ncbi:hypothetical protein [Sphingobacterium sp. MYb382]|uniref:hypothetical protein n=1 Tax=Sphingobacterium sp. MYb382 TaxID=2745278 RepID=UPI0030A34B89
MNRLLSQELVYLKNSGKVFEEADTLQKQEFIKIVYENNLYYRNEGSYGILGG